MPHLSAPVITRPRRPGTTAAISLLAAGVISAASLVLSTQPADAAEPAAGSAPVTAPDKITLTQYEGVEVDVLENDTDPDGDRLDICRLGKIPDGLSIEKIYDGGGYPTMVRSSEATGSSPSAAPAAPRRGRKDPRLIVLGAGEPGTYTVTYYACDYSYLTPGTLTIEVKAAPQIKVKVTKLDNRPGRLKVTNTSGFPVRFIWGAYTADDLDGTMTVTRKPVVITVNRPSIIWAAMNKRTPYPSIGAVRQIRLPAGTKHLPPGAPSPAVMDHIRPRLGGHAAQRSVPTFLRAITTSGRN